MSVKKLVGDINNEIYGMISSVEKNQLFEIGDRVIVYGSPSFSSDLYMSSDSIKNITKTGIINLVKSNVRFKNGRELGNTWHPSRIIKYDKDIAVKYNKGVSLKKAELIIRDKIHLLPVEEILSLAEKLQQIENDNKDKGNQDD